MTETKQNSLGTEPIGRLLLKFSVPTALTLMVNCLYNIVDQIFIGHAVGIKGVAATNVTFPIGIIAAALALLIGDGCAANVSLHLGRGEQEEADRTFANAVMLLFGVGILLSVFGCIFARQLVVFFGASPSVVAEAVLYMSIILLGQPFGMCNMAFTAIIRADGNPQYMMRSMMIGAALNVVLDPIFIFVFRWGIQGAALATIIGQIVSGVIALAYLPRFSHFAIRKKYLHLKWRFIGDIVRLGFPSLCTQTATAATQIVMNNLMRKYGAATIYGSEIALSCYGLMMKIYQIAHAMFVGLASGTQPINGFNFGARQYERVKQTIQTAAKISIGISVLWFLVFRYGGGFCGGGTALSGICGALLPLVYAGLLCLWTAKCDGILLSGNRQPCEISDGFAFPTGDFPDSVCTPSFGAFWDGWCVGRGSCRGCVGVFACGFALEKGAARLEKEKYDSIKASEASDVFFSA